MKLLTQIFFFLITASAIASPASFSISADIVKSSFAGNKGAIVIIDCSSEKVFDFFPAASSEMLAPCSTFKIWNTLIGLECGLIFKPEESFYIWDGKKRSFEDWNQNLTLRRHLRSPVFLHSRTLRRKSDLRK